MEGQPLSVVTCKALYADFIVLVPYSRPPISLVVDTKYQKYE